MGRFDIHIPAGPVVTTRQQGDSGHDSGGRCRQDSGHDTGHDTGHDSDGRSRPESWS
jgi:hypothetical protein